MTDDDFFEPEHWTWFMFSTESFAHSGDDADYKRWADWTFDECLDPPHWFLNFYVRTRDEYKASRVAEREMARLFPRVPASWNHVEGADAARATPDAIEWAWRRGYAVRVPDPLEVLAEGNLDGEEEVAHD